jgi:hypothetical protein
MINLVTKANELHEKRMDLTKVKGVRLAKGSLDVTCIQPKKEHFIIDFDTEYQCVRVSEVGGAEGHFYVVEGTLITGEYGSKNPKIDYIPKDLEIFEINYRWVNEGRVFIIKEDA